MVHSGLQGFEGGSNVSNHKGFQQLAEGGSRVSTGFKRWFKRFKGEVKGIAKFQKVAKGASKVSSGFKGRSKF